MPLKVAYIDDETDLCEVFQDSFNSVDFEVTAYSDPEKAIVELTKNPPDIAFIDYRLPKHSGDQIAQRLPDGFPKYLITGDLDAAPKYRFTQVLPKPFDDAKIQAILNELATKLSRKAA